MHTADLVEKWAKENGDDFSGENVSDSDWNSVDLPARFGKLGLGGHRGVVWFRKTVELSDPLPVGDAYLATGSNDGVDAAYVNGVRVLTGSSVLNWRNAKLPAGLLKAGKNSIAIRFIGLSGANAGFTFPGVDGLNLRVGGSLTNLVGAWKMKKGFELKSAKPLPDQVEDNPNWPTTLYNGMLHPLMPMAIKGALWYQGETNVGRGEQYSRLLPAMITDWRRGFGQGDFPFFVVQLANFGRQNADPVNSGWAELREAQATGVSRVKNAGLAVTIDIGEGNDIHPKNKQEVGRRLALSALKVAFGRRIEDSGPTAKKVTRGGAVIQVEFDHADGLEIRRGKHSGFAIAGRDGKYVWADAKVIGKTVVLSALAVKEPTFVRYGWDDDPVVTLFNKDGLPAVPFRTK
jgi:sialate O-acetylesterase